MKIICDQREVKSEVPDLLKSMGVEVEVVTLEDGDYHLPNNVICTRKTYTDFFGSRNSGHFSDEIFRLLTKYPNHIVFCLVEKNTYNTRDEMAVASKAIKSMQFIIPTIQCKDKRDTAESLIHYAKKAENNELQNFKRRIVLQDHTNDIIRLYMSFEGIAQKTAEEIFKIYPKPIDFFNKVLETYEFDKEKHKTKRFWHENRWDKNIKFVGDKKNKAIGDLLKGVYENAQK